MVLNYLGISHETPTQMLEKAFDVNDPKNTDFLNLLNESGLILKHRIIIGNDIFHKG